MGRTKKTVESKVEQHFSVSSAARRLDLSLEQVRKLCNIGELNGVNAAENGYDGKHRHWIIPESELIAFLNRRRNYNP